SSRCQQLYPWLRPCSFSKGIHRNGFEKHFRKCISLPGGRVTGRLVSAFQAWIVLWRTFGTRQSIIGRDPFARSMQRCLRRTVLCSRNRCSLEAFCRPCRDLTYCESVCPALKRWAIFAPSSFASESIIERLVCAKVTSSRGFGSALMRNTTVSDFESRAPGTIRGSIERTASSITLIAAQYKVNRPGVKRLHAMISETI